MSRNSDREFKVALEAAVASFGLEPLAETQTAKLVKHYAMVGRWNRRINLTRITEPEDAARLHYAESLFGARFIGDAKTMLDIGSGAGFPAIPIAIMRPDLRVTALEANRKKALFLEEAKEKLELKNLSVLCARLAETDLSGYELLASRALERAAETFPSVIKSLRAGQRLMLFCSPELVAKIERDAAHRPTGVFAIPVSEARLVAIFSGS